MIEEHTVKWSKCSSSSSSSCVHVCLKVLQYQASPVEKQAAVIQSRTVSHVQQSLDFLLCWSREPDWMILTWKSFSEKKRNKNKHGLITNLFTIQQCYFVLRHSVLSLSLFTVWWPLSLLLLCWCCSYSISLTLLQDHHCNRTITLLYSLHNLGTRCTQESGRDNAVVHEWVKHKTFTQETEACSPCSFET